MSGDMSTESSVFVPTFSKIFRHSLAGEWPAGPVFCTLLSVADEDGCIDCFQQALSNLTGWPIELLIQGCERLRELGYIELMHPEKKDRWIISNYAEVIGNYKRPSYIEWQHLRSIVFERDNWTCVYCGQRGGVIECDHVVPISKGGTNSIENLVTACFKCNRSKRDMSLTEWKDAQNKNN